MSKYNNPFEDTLKVFETAIANAGIDNFITIKVLTDNKLNKVVAKSVKSNDLVKYETKNDVYIFVKETIFEQLTPEQQKMIAEEVIAGIHYDMEKDKLVTNIEDVKAYSGILSKYGYDEYHVLQESIRTLFSVEKR